MSQSTPSYGPPPQVTRRDSQEQVQMISQRMKHLNMYQTDGYGGPRSPYDHVQPSYIASSGSERGAYFQYYPPGNSYSNVVSRGKEVGKKTICLFVVIDSGFKLINRDEHRGWCL